MYLLFTYSFYESSFACDDYNENKKTHDTTDTKICYWIFESLHACWYFIIIPWTFMHLNFPIWWRLKISTRGTESVLSVQIRKLVSRYLREYVCVGIGFHVLSFGFVFSSFIKGSRVPVIEICAVPLERKGNSALLLSWVLSLSPLLPSKEMLLIGTRAA